MRWRSLPPDLPLGYHSLVDDGAVERDLIVVPGWLDVWPSRCWGVVAQLYSLPSPNGVGDLATLERIGRWVADRGGRVIGLNPFGDPLPVTPREPSPYSTSSREHLDPLLVDLTRLGVTVPTPAPSSVGSIDRDRAWTVVRRALDRAWQDAGSPHPARPRSARGVLRDWPSTTAAAGARGPTSTATPTTLPWRRSPATTPSSSRCGSGSTTSSSRSSSRWWAPSTGADVTLMGDLPVGVSADGYDAWLDQDLLLPWRAHRRAARHVQPRRAGLAAALLRPAPAPVRRLPHRSCGCCAPTWHASAAFASTTSWGCSGSTASPRARRRRRARTSGSAATDLVDLLALEAHRAGAFVVGEDLGTVEDHVRHAMAERGIGGTRVVLFEEGDPSWWPERSLATVTTHDLPTIRGALEHTRPAPRRAAGGAHPLVRRRPRGRRHSRTSRSRPTDVSPPSGSGIALVTLEDLAWSRDRVNLPGTVDEHPNWRIPLDESRLDDAFAAALVAAMHEHR